ncbi:RNA-binding protein Ro60-like [Saccostrea echinata]|uniref:RNA-binding protein Ro60-like n=1 Tax=Saccostrea echinata TaxID=191078 RepID=UPI002A81C4BC|nr:RNA-binding protein Ro60-like [Saccostrea echinata]
MEDEEALWKFLFLGSLVGVYRPGYRQIEDSDADVIRRLIKNGRHNKVIEYICRASRKCLKFYPIAYTLALCARHDKKAVSKQAYAALPYVCRTPSHLFQFLSFCRTRFKCRGWPRSHRRAIAAWYTENEQYRNDPKKLAIHVTKYKRRHMFSQKKVIKSCHPKPPNEAFQYIFHYVTNGVKKANKGKANEKETQNVKGYITAVEFIKNKHNSDQEEVIKEVIQKWGIPWESIPTSHLQSPEIWRALLRHNMPMIAMIRNLGRMGRLGILKPKSEDERIICERLRSVDLVESIHPIQLLAAFAAYRRGRGLRDSGHTWDVNKEIERALVASYSLSAKNFEPTKSRVLIAIDVNMNMDFHVLGIPSMSCKEAAVALSLLFHSSFEVQTITFFKSAQKTFLENPSGDLFDIDFSEKHTESGEKETNYNVPFHYAKENKFDIILLLTDTLETKDIDKIRRSYQKSKQPNSKCVVVCFKTSRPASVLGDSSMLDVVGVDEYAVEIIMDFIKDYKREMIQITGGQGHEKMEVEN